MKLKYFRPMYVKIIVLFSLIFFSYNTSSYAESTTPTNNLQSFKLSETGEYIVKLHKNASKMMIQKKAKESGATLLHDNKEHMLIKLNKTIEKRVLTLLASDPGIEYIEPNIRITKSSEIADPGFNEQWGLHEIDTPAAWDEMTSTSKVIVAVIDTGVDYTHPDLANRVDTANGFDYVNWDSDAMDDDGHGTHVAGIVAAEENSQGIVGVVGKANVKILPLKVLDDKGEGSLFDAALAVMDAADLGASVINMSLGGKWEAEFGEPRFMKDAVKYAMGKGAVVIAAAGNETDDVDNYIPAAIPGVITVSAVNQSLTLTDFSNFGSSVDIAAPGEEILSTYIGGQYVFADGTSQATPFVSGIAALLKVQENNLTVTEITNRLTRTATDLGKSGRDDLYGYGLVNAYRALQKPLDKIMPNVKKLSLKPGDKSQITISAYYKDRTKEDVSPKVEWTSSDNQVASVENGLVTAHKFGTSTITARYKDKTITIPVTIAIKSLNPDQRKVSLKPAGTTTIQLTGVLLDGTKTEIISEDVVWQSQNEGIATVDNGVVTAINFGKTNITAAYGTKTVKIPVEVAVTRLESAMKKLSMKPDGTSTIVVTATFGDKSKVEVPAEEVVWKSQNDQIATIENGIVTAKNFGRTNITATYGGKTVKIPVEIKLTRLVATPSKLLIKPDGMSPIELTAVYGDEKEVVTESAEWKTSNSEIAVYEDGNIVAKGFGKATITATYRGKSAKVSVDTNLKKLQADTTKLTLKVNDSHQLTFNATYSDNSIGEIEEGIEWTSTNDAVASVDENGLITAKVKGKATITAKYGGKSVKISITVNE